MFVKLLVGIIHEDVWRPVGSVVDVPEDKAKQLIQEKAGKLDGGPVKTVPEEGVIYYGEVAVEERRRGPGRPRKEDAATPPAK